MALSDFTGPNYINAWTEDLDRRWSERAAMADCVVRTLIEWQRVRDGRQEAGAHEKKLHSKIRLLELGVGAGGLTQAVLSALIEEVESERTSAIEYTGIDLESALALHVDELLAKSGHQDARLIQADLRGDAWPRGLGPLDAVFTLQTLHDLGGVDDLETIYRQAYGLLATGGILVNADFVVPFEKDDLDRPRRFPVEMHQNLLANLGFVDFRCRLQRGKMACMSARRL